MKTCSVRSKRRDRYQSDNCATNNKTKLFIHITTLINIFHDNFEEVGSFCPQKPSFRNKNAAMIRVKYTVVRRAYKLLKY